MEEVLWVYNNNKEQKGPMRTTRTILIPYYLNLGW